MAERRTIFITGASGGIGGAVALKFLDEGALVWGAFYKGAGRADALARAAAGRPGELRLVECDISAAATVKDVFAKIAKLDALVNAAGIVEDEILSKASEESWDAVLGVNFKGVFNAMKAASKPLAKNGGGHIINIASISALKGNEGQASYSASKGAVIGASLAAARELGGSNVRVNVVLPGFLETGMTAGLDEEVKKKARAKNVLGRISTVEEVAAFIHFLSTTENISGQIFNLDSRIIGWA